MFCTGISALAEKLKGKTKSIILYETWARKEGSPTLAERGLTPDSMYKLISEAYAKLAKTMNFTVSKVGAAFQKAVKEFPDTDLYDPDLTHPSLSGSSLAALIHFKTLFGKLPENTSALELSIELIESMAE